MAKSILHSKEEGTCYLCKMLEGDYARKITQEHHVIFGTANRKLAEKYGLKVYLCLEHHEYGKMAVHNNKQIARMLQQIAQRSFEEKHSREEWMQTFGRNFLDD